MERNQLQTGCFSQEERTQICRAIQKKYAAVSSSAEGYFKYTVGKTGALALGYDSDLVEQAPSELIGSFCGVGNPFTISPLQEGSTVLDIGSGAGFDLYVASCHVGKNGKVIGTDLTEEMVEKARYNMEKLAVPNAEVHLVSTQILPFEDSTFDVVLSNGVINLSPEKQHLFSEIFRVLKSGGRLQFADIMLEKKLPPHLAVSVESWSQ